jgi:hypothetical protein
MYTAKIDQELLLALRDVHATAAKRFVQGVPYRQQPAWQLVGEWLAKITNAPPNLMSIDLAFTPRLGRWVEPLNMQIVPYTARPGLDPRDFLIAYRIKHVFTTLLGSWEPSEERGAIESWARELYLQPQDTPDYFDEAGGDHHLFAAVLGLDGKLDRTITFKFWSDGLECLTDPGYTGFIRVAPKPRSGWANIPIYGGGSSYVPERGEHGPWCWTVGNGAGDVMVGGGLPANQHVSTFVVWQTVVL